MLPLKWLCYKAYKANLKLVWIKIVIIIDYKTYFHLIFKLQFQFTFYGQIFIIADNN